MGGRRSDVKVTKAGRGISAPQSWMWKVVPGGARIFARRMTRVARSYRDPDITSKSHDSPQILEHGILQGT